MFPLIPICLEVKTICPLTASGFLVHMGHSIIMVKPVVKWRCRWLPWDTPKAPILAARRAAVSFEDDPGREEEELHAGDKVRVQSRPRAR